MDVVRWMNVGRVTNVVAVAALVVSLAAWLTAWVGIRQAKRQAKAAEDQAAAAQEAADAARKQVEVAYRAVEVSQDQAKAAQEQVALAVKQLEHAERIRIEQMRAVVLADIRADETQPQLVVLVVHNQGQTVARNVRVRFEPPLKAEPEATPLDEWSVSTLGPGVQLARPITSGVVFFNSEIVRDRQRVTVTAEDSFGPLEELTYDIDLAALGAVTNARKTLYHVWEALEKIAKNGTKGDTPIRVWNRPGTDR